MISGIGINNEKLPGPERTKSMGPSMDPPAYTERAPTDIGRFQAPLSPVSMPSPSSSRAPSSTAVSPVSPATAHGPPPHLPPRTTPSRASSSTLSLHTPSHSSRRSSGSSARPSPKLKKHTPHYVPSHHSAPSTASASGSAGPGTKVARAMGAGLLAIVVPPIAAAGVAVAGSAALIYGTGKILEGVGRGIAAGPEVMFRAYRSPRGRRVRRMFGASVSTESLADVREEPRAARLERRYSR